MRKLFFIAMMILGLGFSSYSQLDKVSWSADAEKIDETTYKISLTANVAEGWYIYSQHIDKGGPIPTEFSFTGSDFTTEGVTAEYSDITKEMYDEVFEIDVKKFGGDVTFTQVVKTNGGKPKINALITYMSCNDSRCNPPKQIKLTIL